MAGFAVGNQGGLQPKDASALLQRLRQSAPAPNPSTPSNRMDSTTERLQSCNQVRVSIEKVMTTINEDEVILKNLFIAMHAVVNQVLAGVDPQQILTQLTTKLGQATAPAAPIPQPGPTAGAPGMPPPPMAGAAPPPVPVSPGPPG